MPLNCGMGTDARPKYMVIESRVALISPGRNQTYPAAGVVGPGLEINLPQDPIGLRTMYSKPYFHMGQTCCKA